MTKNRLIFFFIVLIFTSCTKERIVPDDNSGSEQFQYGSCDFGPEVNIFPNSPSDSSNPFYLGKKKRHKQFGSGCIGNDNVIYFVTRVANGHGVSGGNIYWSKSVDEGATWEPLRLFEQDVVNDASTEDLRDCNIYYDAVTEKYFLIYTHLYGIVNNNYSNVTGQLKVFIGDRPFESEMIDISPGIVPFDNGATVPSMQTFESFHRVGSNLYLPCYKWSSGGDEKTSIIKFTFNDVLPLTNAVQNMQWNTVKDWDIFGDTEITMFLSYLEDGTHQLNVISRRSEIDDMGYYTYSVDGGNTWAEKEPLGFQVSGGPRVFEINGEYMLIAREQYISNQMTVYAMFSKDGKHWGGRKIVSDCGTGYASLIKCRSGKNLLFYGKENGHLGIQVYREVFFNKTNQ